MHIASASGWQSFDAYLTPISTTDNRKKMRLGSVGSVSKFRVGGLTFKMTKINRIIKRYLSSLRLGKKLV
jgi:hypothetical protein